jgi:hypothetical protein
MRRAPIRLPATGDAGGIVEAPTGSSATDLQVEVDLDATARPTDLHDPAQRAAVERSLCAMPGVLGARLVPGFDRQVDELHVLTALDRAPKQTVRDVQTLLMARYGIPTDHRVVSVVQLDEHTTIAATSRVLIERVSSTRSGLTLTAEVTLLDGDERYVGVADASASPLGLQRAVAGATLDAAGELIGDECRVDLEGIAVDNSLGQAIAVCLLQVRTERETLTLTGSALVREVEADAIARAVLDALNRTIGEATS